MFIDKINNKTESPLRRQFTKFFITAVNPYNGALLTLNDYRNLNTLRDIESCMFAVRLNEYEKSITI